MSKEAPYGWVVVWATFVCLALIFGVSYSFAAFFASLAAEFAAQRADVSWIFGLSGLVYFVLGTLGGIGLCAFLDLALLVELGLLAFRALAATTALAAAAVTSSPSSAKNPLDLARYAATKGRFACGRNPAMNTALRGGAYGVEAAAGEAPEAAGGVAAGWSSSVQETTSSATRNGSASAEMTLVADIVAGLARSLVASTRDEDTVVWIDPYVTRIPMSAVTLREQRS